MSSIASRTDIQQDLIPDLTLNETLVALGAAVGDALKAAGVPKAHAAKAIGLSRTRFLGRLCGATCFRGAEMDTIAKLTGPGLAAAVDEILKRAPKRAPKERVAPADVNAAELVAAWPTGSTTRYALRHMEKTVDGVRWVNQRGLLIYLSELLDNGSVTKVESIVAPAAAQLGRYLTCNPGHPRDQFRDYFYPEAVAVKVVAAVLAAVEALDKLVLS